MIFTSPAKRNIVSSACKVLVVSVFLVGATLSFPTRTYAVLPVHDPINNISALASAAKSTSLALKEYSLDPLAYSVSKIALHSLTKSVVNWINGGFNGSPAFVQDLDQTLLSTGDAEAVRFIDQFVNSGSLQDVPWKDDIAQTVLSGYLRSTSNDGFALDNPYTLKNYTDDPQACVGGNFGKCGLDGWMAMVLSPANTPRGLLKATQNRLASNVGNARGNKLTETTWANGYQSFRGKCTPKTGKPTDLLSGTPYAGSTGNQSAIAQLAREVSSTATDLGSADACANKPILTPGALIAQSANKYLVDSGVDQYISADEISEVVNALMGQLVGNVLGGGGLLGLSSPTSGGGSSYIDRASDPSQTVKASSSLSLSESFLTTISNQEDQLTQYKTAWITISNAASAAKTALAGSSCSPVDSVLSQAGIAVSSATSAIASLEKTKAQLTASVASDPTTQSAQVAAATTAYQQLLSSGTLPTASDILSANSESQERPADSTNGVTASLYSQMMQIASSKTCSL